MNSTQTTSAPLGRDGSADILRAVLVVYVVGYLHLGGYIGSGELHVHWSTVPITNVVLGTFTFLSGYMLATWEGSTDLGAIVGFYRRRLLRIYPLYLVALVGFVLVWLTDLTSAIKAALGVSMFLPPAPMTLWYVAMIIVCYVLAPLLVMVRIKHAAVNGLGIWLLMLAYGIVVPDMDYRILTQFAAFVAGVMCRRLQWRAHWRGRPKALAAAFAVTLAAAVVSLKHPMIAALAAIPCVVLGPLLLLVLVDRFRSRRRLTGLVVQSLAYASFSAYLFHRIFFEILMRLIWPTDPWMQLAVLAFLGLPAIWIGSWSIQWLYDRLLATWGIR